MSVCPACAAENPPGFAYCGHCGAAVAALRCGSCGASTQQGQRYCGACGAALAGADLGGAPAPPSAAIGERKLATILFADVVGFTALAESTDPEALARRVDAALRGVAEIVVEHGGTVDKYLGDALMAVYGVPAAHDDDAARAVAAALRVRDSGADLRFSIGINSGEVMVTAVGDGGGVTVIGDAVNVASRLETSAAPGEILVGPLTAELVADDFVLEARAPALVKGRSQAVAAHAVIGPRGGGAGSAGAPLLLGRDAELEFLRVCWRRAAERDRAQLVLLTGQPGVGKTRLAAEVADRVREECSVAWAACPGYGALVGGRLAQQLAEQLGSDEDDAARAGLDDHGLWQLRRLVAARAAAQPVLIVVDDLHHARANDLDGLAQLCSRLGELPVTLLLCGRPQPGDWLTRFPGATTLHLDGLAQADAERLLALLAGEAPLDPSDAAELARQAAGNPLHLRELLRLLEAGEPAQAGATGLDERQALPPTLQAVLSARLDSLAPGNKALLQDVSVFSDGATLDDLTALAGRDPAVPLAQLLDAGLLCQREDRYHVTDPLLRELAYEHLPHAARGDRHRRAAAVASTSVGRARHLALAARYHAADAGLRQEAAAQLALAGSEQLQASRLGDGVQLLERAVELGHADPWTLLRLAQADLDLGRTEAALRVLDRIAPTGDPRLEAELVHVRGNLTGSPELLDEAAQRWQDLGDRSKLGWALANKGMVLFNTGRMHEAALCHEQAMELFREAGDRAGVAAAGQSLTLTRPDDPRVPSWLSDGLELARERGDLALERNGLVSLAWSQLIRGEHGGEARLRETFASAERLVQVCAELGDVPFQVHGHCILAMAARMVGRLEAAQEHVRRAQHLARSGSADQQLLDATAFVVAAALDGAATAPAPLDGSGPLAIVAEAAIVEALLLAARFEEALRRTAELDPEPPPGQQAFIVRLLGAARATALVLEGRYEQAEVALETARAAARAVGAYPTEASVTALLAEIAICRGDTEAAARLLASLPEDPGGLAGLQLLRVRCLLGEPVRDEVERQAAQLHAPGLLPAAVAAD